MNKNQLRINIKIESRVYPLKIDRQDEEKHRLAAKMVNETLTEYKKLFRDKDAQDVLAMTAFQLALSKTELLEQENKSLFIDEIKNLNDDISDFFKEKNKK
ncbi:MAG: cell division protein ZapA [Prolixibacteraceae bacterium]